MPTPAGLSVVLLVDDQRPFVRDALERLERQDFAGPTEVVAVDFGGSTDCLGFARKVGLDLTFIPHHDSRPITDTWRSAFEGCRHDVVVVLDSYLHVDTHHLTSCAGALSDSSAALAVERVAYFGRTPFGRALAHLVEHMSRGSSRRLVQACARDAALEVLRRVDSATTCHADVRSLSAVLLAADLATVEVATGSSRPVFDSASELYHASRNAQRSPPRRGEQFAQGSMCHVAAAVGTAAALLTMARRPRCVVWRGAAAAVVGVMLLVASDARSGMRSGVPGVAPHRISLARLTMAAGVVRSARWRLHRSGSNA